jgi:hypothetical protein
MLFFQINPVENGSFAHRNNYPEINLLLSETKNNYNSQFILRFLFHQLCFFRYVHFHHKLETKKIQVSLILFECIQ